jgi:redox-sensitive bicupin YhaK (pirin superfamily)
MRSLSSSLRFSDPVAQQPHAVGTSCEIRQFRHTDFAGGLSPLILVDHFVMTGPTFELHPHAGMSAVTVLFEDTQGCMNSHDSVRNNHRIEAGDLHWTLAGKGIVHTQLPAGADMRLNGLQLFVNLPRRLKRLEPRTELLRAIDVPVIQRAGTRLRILAGDLEGATSPFHAPEPILIVDGLLAGGTRTVLPLPAGWNLWLYARAGNLIVWDANDSAQRGATTLCAGEAVAVSALTTGLVAVEASENEVKFVAIAGQAIDEPIAHGGPFVMNSQEELTQAMEDFRRGRFGTVSTETPITRR